MKTAALSLGLILGLSTIAHADVPGPDWMTKEQVTTKLQGMGYSDIRKLEADDGHWEGDAVKEGRVMEIHVDPHSGAVTKSDPKH